MNPEKTNPEKTLNRWLLIAAIALLAAVLALQLWQMFGGRDRPQTRDANPQALSADPNTVSPGKDAMIQDVQSLNAELSYDALAELSVEELEQLWETGAPGMPIGRSAAAYAAEEYAGTTAIDSITWDADPELDESPAHYEVELHHAAGNYEYKVDAYTGQVLEGRANVFQSVPSAGEAPQTPSPVPKTQPDAGPETAEDAQASEAKAAALAHAGVQEADIEGLVIKPDRDDGVAVYEIKFRSGGKEYEYKIEASTGAILKAEQEWGSAPRQNSAGYIGGDAAKQAALTHAGVQADGAVKWKLDEDDGRGIYEVEFRSGGVEYEYEIDAATGAVLKAEQET